MSRQCEDTDSIPVKAVESFQCYYTSCQETLNCKRFESRYKNDTVFGPVSLYKIAASQKLTSN